MLLFDGEKFICTRQDVCNNHCRGAEKCRKDAGAVSVSGFFEYVVVFLVDSDFLLPRVWVEGDVQNISICSIRCFDAS